MRLKTGIIEVDLKNKPWGDRHFAVIDLSGIGVDVVTHRQ